MPPALPPGASCGSEVQLIERRPVVFALVAVFVDVIPIGAIEINGDAIVANSECGLVVRETVSVM